MTYDEWAEENLNFTVSLAFPDQGKILLDKYRKCWQDAQAALRTPAPAATVTGWRLLEVGEVIQDGDEMLLDDWEKVLIAGDKVNKSTVRRRLTPPAPGVTDVPDGMVGNVIPSLLAERLMDKGFELGYQAGHTDGMIDAHTPPALTDTSKDS